MFCIKKISLFILLFIALAALNKKVSAQTPADSTAATDSLLLLQIEAQMQTTNDAAPFVPRVAASSNPDISVIGDFGASYINAAKRNFDAYLNEAEFSFQSVVDPYIRADFFLSLGKDEDTHKYAANIEEGYLTSTSLPWGLQLKAGKFKSAFGRINPVHAHALPFIDLPNAYENLFGEGINDDGVSLSWLLPNHAFYQELTAQAFAGYGDSPLFIRSDRNNFLYVGHLKNFFSLNDNATLEFGLSAAMGPNDSSLSTQVGGVDLTYKWKPLEHNTYKSFTWQSEIFYAKVQKTENIQVNSLGLYSLMSLQIAKRSFITARYNYAQDVNAPAAVLMAYSATYGWLATEFQKIELEGKMTEQPNHSQTYEAWLRWIFVIGTHGAHQY